MHIHSLAPLFSPRYHVVKGHELTSTYKMPNSTLGYNHLPTNRNNSEIVSFSDTFGRLFVHEDCVESHTQDEFGCKMQVSSMHSLLLIHSILSEERKQGPAAKHSHTQC